MESGSFELDIIGQQPLLRIYTQLALIYPLPASYSSSDIISTLQAGLKKLSGSFPWIAGQVIHEGYGEGNTGVFKIVPFGETPPLVTKDFTKEKDAMTMADLREARFPSRMLDEPVIAPRNTLPTPDDPPEFPTFIVQANFLGGGLILTFLSAHNAMDMTGHGQIMSLLSKACRGEDFTEEELRTGNLERANLVPIIEEFDLTTDLYRQVAPTAPSAPLNPPPAYWTYFIFSAKSLSALKALATKTLPSDSGVDFVSTDDSISAFIWKHVSRARTSRYSDPNTKTIVGRAVDVRSYLNIPKTYTGLMQNISYHELPLHEVASAPLGVLAANFRSGLVPSKLARSTQALASYMKCTPDKSRISLTARHSPGTDIALSSWSKIDAYELDFGFGLGTPEAVRRPQLAPFESLMYLMPKGREGEIAATICLRNEDMERLKSDEEWSKFAEFIG